MGDAPDKVPLVPVLLIRQQDELQLVIAVERDHLQDQRLGQAVHIVVTAHQSHCTGAGQRHTHRHVYQLLGLRAQRQHGILEGIVLHGEFLFRALDVRVHGQIAHAQPQPQEIFLPDGALPQVGLLLGDAVGAILLRCRIFVENIRLLLAPAPDLVPHTVQICQIPLLPAVLAPPLHLLFMLLCEDRPQHRAQQHAHRHHQRRHGLGDIAAAGDDVAHRQDTGAQRRQAHGQGRPQHQGQRHRLHLLHLGRRVDGDVGCLHLAVEPGRPVEARLLRQGRPGPVRVLLLGAVGLQRRRIHCQQAAGIVDRQKSVAHHDAQAHDIDQVSGLQRLFLDTQTVDIGAVLAVGVRDVPALPVIGQPCVLGGHIGVGIVQRIVAGTPDGDILPAADDVFPELPSAGVLPLGKQDHALLRAPDPDVEEAQRLDDHAGGHVVLRVDDGDGLRAPDHPSAVDSLNAEQHPRGPILLRVCQPVAPLDLGGERHAAHPFRLDEIDDHKCFPFFCGFPRISRGPR